MLSIIICSRHKQLPAEFISNIQHTVGVEYELITINNSSNQYSIFSAYNKGFTKSKYPYLCFVHEDVKFYTHGWGQKIITHLKSPEAGIIGLAGGDLATRVPAPWSTLMPVVNIIQSDKSGKKQTRHIQSTNDFDSGKRPVILLDGVFLCMKRKLFDVLNFDENLKGFHGYDFDISMQSIIAGYTNYVINDIELEHFSRGNTDLAYYKNLIAIFKKWEKHLPLIGKNVTEAQKKQIPAIEEKKLKRLIKKMARKGFTSKEIISETYYYANLIGSEKVTRFLRIRLCLLTFNFHQLFSK